MTQKTSWKVEVSLTMVISGDISLVSETKPFDTELDAYNFYKQCENSGKEKDLPFLYQKGYDSVVLYKLEGTKESMQFCSSRRKHLP